MGFGQREVRRVDRRSLMLLSIGEKSAANSSTLSSYSAARPGGAERTKFGAQGIQFILQAHRRSSPLFLDHLL